LKERVDLIVKDNGVIKWKKFATVEKKNPKIP
jgi:hypothetical protein